MFFIPTSQTIVIKALVNIYISRKAKLISFDLRQKLFYAEVLTTRNNFNVFTLSSVYVSLSRLIIRNTVRPQAGAP